MQIDTIKLAVDIIEQAVKIGVRDFCVCPGARNYQLASFLINDQRLTSYFHTDERSAAFFALGKIKKERRPVAVITTSGTAAGEILPAAMEAYYTGLPLMLITADRPRSYRQSGAPQAAEQVNIFGVYTPFQLDLEGGEPFDLEQWNQNYPAHINACFEEPTESEQPPLALNSLNSKPKEPTFSYEGWKINPERVFLEKEGPKHLSRFFQHSNHLFVIVSSLKEQDREVVVKFLIKLGAPVFLEGQSGLREDDRLAHLRVHRSEKIWAHAQKSNYEIDSVLRIGGVPTFRFWRDLEDKRGNVTLFSVNDVPFTGTSWGTMAFGNISQFFKNFPLQQAFDTKKAAKWLADEKEYAKKLHHLLRELPQSQAALVYKLSKIIPEGSTLFLGNSLSIRDWDMVATWEDKKIRCSASRGLNGIDGQIATFLGMMDEHRENWALLGDLTTIYDMNAFWILQYLQNYNYRFRFVVMNNHGGKIFTGKFSDPRFQNPHQIHFEYLAKFWGIDYLRLEDIPHTFSSPSPRLIIELNPHMDQTIEFPKRLVNS